MSNQPQYTVMGDDGREYGPVSADQIREWIRENRLERKSPVKPDTAKDWLFLEMLPEFKDVLPAIPGTAPEQRSSWKWLILFFLLVILAGVLLVLKKFNLYPFH